MNRKDFMKTTMAGLGSLIVLPSCVSDIKPYRFFTVKEANCVIALSEQIIPPDEEWPGATYAGVIDYIDKQLVEVFIEEQSNYRKGIQALQATCQNMFGKDFEATIIGL